MSTSPPPFLPRTSFRTIFLKRSATMRSPVIVVSSTSAFNNNISRNVHIGERELESHLPSTSNRGSTQPIEVRGPTNALPRPRLTTCSQDPRVRKPLNYEGFVRQTHPKIIDRKDFARQVPSPHSLSPGSTSVPTDLRDASSSRCHTNAASSVTNVVSAQEGILVRCLMFLKLMGTRVVISPDALNDELDHTIAGKNGHNNFVGLPFLRRFSVALVADSPAQNATVANLPVV